MANGVYFRAQIALTGTGAGQFVRENHQTIQTVLPKPAALYTYKLSMGPAYLPVSCVVYNSSSEVSFLSFPNGSWSPQLHSQLCILVIFWSLPVQQS